MMTREEAVQKSRRIGTMNYYITENKALINEIYNDFESRTCENCKHCSKRMQSENDKKIGLINCLYMDTWFHYSFGCNKFERKTDG